MCFSIDLILLLEYSFALTQNNIKDSFSLAEQKYKESGTSAKVSQELNSLFDLYSATSNREKRVKLLIDIISHHHICKEQGD